MLVKRNFMEIVLEANKMSPKIFGQLFTCNATKNQIQILSNPRAKIGFKIRFNLILLNATLQCIRFFNIKYQSSTQINERTTLNTILCIRTISILLVSAERYRIRLACSKDFVDFFNGAIYMEMSYTKSTKKLV